MKYMEIKRYNSYIKGVIGQDIKLTLWQRIKLLFHKGITVAFIEESLRKAEPNVKNPRWDKERHEYICQHCGGVVDLTTMTYGYECNVCGHPIHER